MKKKKTPINGENKKRFQAHFRKFHDKTTTSHPQYVYDECGRQYKILGITSSPTTNGVLNIKLEKNPEPHNTDDAYVRPVPGKINKGVRNDKLKGWKFTGNDKNTVRIIIETHDKSKK